MSATIKTAPVTPAIAVPAKVAAYHESATITLVKLAGKRGASAVRFAHYGAAPGATTTVKAYLDACLVDQPEEPRYRWRADLAWDVKRGFITIQA